MLANIYATFELEIFGSEHWEISFGQKDPKQTIQVEELSIENENLAVLSWQAGLPCPDPRMMKNLGQMVAKALYSHKNATPSKSNSY